MLTVCGAQRADPARSSARRSMSHIEICRVRRASWVLVASRLSWVGGIRPCCVACCAPPPLVLLSRAIFAVLGSLAPFLLAQRVVLGRGFVLALARLRTPIEIPQRINYIKICLNFVLCCGERGIPRLLGNDLGGGLRRLVGGCLPRRDRGSVTSTKGGSPC